MYVFEVAMFIPHKGECERVLQVGYLFEQRIMIHNRTN